MTAGERVLPFLVGPTVVIGAFALTLVLPGVISAARSDVARASTRAGRLYSASTCSRPFRR